jgi:hypothetical protein
MSIVVRYAPVPSSTIEQYDEVTRRLQESGGLPADGFDLPRRLSFERAAASERSMGLAEGTGGVRQARHAASG